ncbi:MAG: OadG family protein [Oscillospiraceae bacterium]|jgi:Na+-transporting methylmalonyl-CoA/oxaloacetate decarboxylase gamma subunit|nr:OadG family protein [Oscillospiraceae bacterium]
MLFLAIEPISVPEAFLLSLVGFAVVFIALMALIAVIKCINALAGGVKKETLAPAGVPAAVSAPAVPASGGTGSAKVPAPGSLGDIDLYTVDDQTAAMLMAIVADDLKAPLNTLRFTSIKEVK